MPDDYVAHFNLMALATDPAGPRLSLISGRPTGITCKAAPAP
ncbi:hypothetical protein [Streptomyces sp. BP-8]|uniref:Uncharacterized protein n=1 Tax=Streptomyces sirii TaxID=3127701 RepID=A0ABZ2QE74_9ACTN